MNRVQLFEKTVNLLLDAYNSGKLEHGSCYACAVGNICRIPAKEVGISNSDWSKLFFTCGDNDNYFVSQNNFKATPVEKIREMINLTGYIEQELRQIEWAFETSIPIRERDYYLNENPKEGQYLGLCAVLEVLKEIHNKEQIVEEKQKLKTIYENFVLV